MGFGNPTGDAVVVRFNAQFQKKGTGMVSFGEKFLSNNDLGSVKGKKPKKEGETFRGTLFCQVKAYASPSNLGKIVEIDIAKDGGWGKPINKKYR